MVMAGVVGFPGGEQGWRAGVAVEKEQRHLSSGWASRAAEVRRSHQKEAEAQEA